MSTLRLLVLLFGLIGSSIHMNGQKTMNKSEVSFSRISSKPGIRNATFTNGAGKRWKMRIQFPVKSSIKNGLVIALHWAGGEDTYKEFNDCLVLPGLENVNAILVSPEGEDQLWDTRNNIDKILAIVANSQKYWNVDPQKIAIMGYSNGGNGSWFFAEKYPELFSAAIPMASSYPIHKKIDVPLYVIHGAKDELFKVSKTKQWVAKTKTEGSNVTLIINEGLSHFQGCAYDNDLKNAGEWLQQIWNKK